jgi:hypothetical protein
MGMLLMSMSMLMLPMLMLPMYVPESFGMYVPDMDSRIRTSDVTDVQMSMLITSLIQKSIL